MYCEYERKHGKTKLEAALEKQRESDSDEDSAATEKDKNKTSGRSNSKISKTAIKRTPLKNKHKKATGELKMFNEIWNERPHVSEISNASLGDDMSPYFMSHICTKGAYSCNLMRLNKRNIILMTPDEHNLWEFGDREKLEKDPKWNIAFERQLEMIRFYYKSKGKVFDEDTDN